MADLRIVDAPEIPTENITGEEKLPTGGSGNYSISLDSLADYTKTKKDLADNTSVDGKVNGVRQELNTHVADLLNPHQVTKGQIGLGNVDNTADADKPVSNSTQAAIISATAPKADKSYVDNALSSKSDKTYVDTKLALKANKTDVYTKLETYTKQESVDLVNTSISTALTPVNIALNLVKRGTANRYDSSLTYNSGERVVLTNGDIVKSTVDGNTNNPNSDMTGWIKTNSASQIFDESGLSQQEINNSLIRIVPNKNDLMNISNPKNGQVVYVTENKKRYVYNSNLAITGNAVTVIGKWEMEIQDSYYASWFAQKDTQIDQSVKLQTGYDYAVSKGRAYIIDAHFYTDPVIDSQDRKTGLFIRSNSSLIFSKGIGKIQQMTTSEQGYDILRIQDVENFAIFEPELIGDKSTHTGTMGEWGYGLSVYQCKNGFIRNPVILNTWGDGIYIGRVWGTETTDTPTNVTISDPVIDGAGRNGISFTAGTNVHILRPFIKNTKGKAPESGIDIEPEAMTGKPKSMLINCSIESPLIENCHLGIVNYFFPNDSTYEIHIKGITTIRNCNQPLIACAGGSNNTGYVLYDRIDILNPTSNTLMQNAWHKSGNFLFTVNEFNTDKSLPFLLTLNGDFATKILGNFEINNITTTDSNRIAYYVPSGISGYTDNSKYNFKDSAKNNAYIDVAASNDLGSNFVLNTTNTHNGYSVSTSTYSNNIWQDPSVAPTIPIYMQTGSDFRALKIGLSNDSSNVGMGCNIMGISTVIDGVTYTRCSTKTLGGWIKFQNTSGGRTKIFDSYGSWNFFN